MIITCCYFNKNKINESMIYSEWHIIYLALVWILLTDLVHFLIPATITWLGEDNLMCIYDMIHMISLTFNMIHFSPIIPYLNALLLMEVIILLISYRIVTIIPLLIGNIRLVHVMGILVVLLFVVFNSVNQAVSLLVLLLAMNPSNAEFFLFIPFFIERLSLVSTTSWISII